MATETRKHLYIDLPPGWQEKLRKVAFREGRTLKAIVINALRPIVKSGKSGMDNGIAKNGDGA